MTLKTDTVNERASVFIHQGFYELNQGVLLELLIIIVVVKVDMLRCVFVRKVEGIPQIIITDGGSPVVLADGTILHPCLVYYIVGINDIGIAALFQLLKYLTDIAFHTL